MKKIYKISGLFAVFGTFLANLASAQTDMTLTLTWWEKNQVNVSLIISLVALIISLKILLNNKKRHK